MTKTLSTSNLARGEAETKVQLKIEKTNEHDICRDINVMFVRF